MITRRKWSFVALCYLSAAPLRVNAIGPGIILRPIIWLFERQAAQGVIRTASGAALRSNVPRLVMIERSSRAARLLREVTVATLGSVAAGEVLAQVKNSPEDSILRWALAYYVILTKSDPEAAMGMWIDPPDYAKHFRHLAVSRPTYNVTGIEVLSQYSDQCMTRVQVTAVNQGESPGHYTVTMYWQLTDVGWRITRFS